MLNLVHTRGGVTVKSRGEEPRRGAEVRRQDEEERDELQGQQEGRDGGDSSLLQGGMTGIQTY